MTADPSDSPTVEPTASGGDEDSKEARRGILTYIPIVLFAVLAVAFYYALRSGGPSTLPSALVGKPVPEFSLDALSGLKTEDGKPSPGFDAAELASGEVTVVNMWASWCGPCRAEHPFLMELAKEPGFRLYGVNYKDQADNARRFLGTLGNPYDAVGVDPLGRASINWGVYGIPETFVIDRKGIIRFKHVGPMGRRIIEEKLKPAIAAAIKDRS
ncbi:MAG: DsbE family thiol:disulfide interchange protein [Hyphomicrobiales bacterium]